MKKVKTIQPLSPMKRVVGGKCTRRLKVILATKRCCGLKKLMNLMRLINVSTGEIAKLHKITDSRELLTQTLSSLNFPALILSFPFVVT